MYKDLIEVNNYSPVARKTNFFPSLRGSFFSNWDNLWDELDALWTDTWFNNSFPTRRAFSTLDSNEDKYDLKIEVPGVELSEITLERQGNVLKIKAEQEKKGSSYFSFEKVLTLPEDVDYEKIEASLKSGILAVTIPRIKVEKKNEEPVKIEVKG